MTSVTYQMHVSSNGRVAALTIGGLVIRNNTKLTSCAISAVCDFVNTNIATISGNGVGCDSQAAVQAACSPLPVTLVQFKASIEGRTALLRWATAEETNSAVFEVEHSPAAGMYQVYITRPGRAVQKDGIVKIF